MGVLNTISSNCSMLINGHVQGEVREVTHGSHDITANRDMRDALGM